MVYRSCPNTNQSQRLKYTPCARCAEALRRNERQQFEEPPNAVTTVPLTVYIFEVSCRHDQNIRRKHEADIVFWFASKWVYHNSIRVFICAERTHLTKTTCVKYVLVWRTHFLSVFSIFEKTAVREMEKNTCMPMHFAFPNSVLKSYRQHLFTLTVFCRKPLIWDIQNKVFALLNSTWKF